MKALMGNGRDGRSENPSLGHAKKERVSLFGTDQRITSGPAARRLHSKAEYMTAPERFADSQIPLAPRAPSIHDPERSSLAISIRLSGFHVRQSRLLAHDVHRLRGARDAICPGALEARPREGPAQTLSRCPGTSTFSTRAGFVMCWAPSNTNAHRVIDTHSPVIARRFPAISLSEVL